MFKKTAKTLILVFVFLAAGVFPIVANIQVRAAGSGTIPQKYKGTITLKRTHNTAEAKVNESVTYKNFLLIVRGKKANPYHFMNQDDISVTTSVEVQDSSATVRCPARTTKDSETGITLMIDMAKRKYAVTAGPIDKIPAQITTQDGKFNDFYGIMGQTAADIPLPVSLTKLSGSKTIPETNGTKVAMDWDLQAI